MAAKKKKVAKKTAAKKKSVAVDDEIDYENILSNWNKVNTNLKVLDENQCLAALNYEANGKRRVHILNRIHARFTKLRSERERHEIMAGGTIAG